eukprot:TRINITY_DN58812_c0_g1_i1.p1 TRINITY_DN58812_c0_g1~~TRINITY_DN58812_c0_g1_i1.p1  ORF type:complete len:342 (-),score=58.68 TRINITY_DN58812_c0_g1_i1:197-1222(-)
MHLLLVRHGQSTNNEIEAEHGAGAAFNAMRVVDPSLSALGHHQAECLGELLGSQLFARRASGRIRLFSSSMTRAMQTLSPLSQKLGITPVVLTDFFEVKGWYTSDGLARGPSRVDLELNFPNFDVSRVPMDGEAGELCSASLPRVKRCADTLRTWAAEEGTSEDLVIIVSHNDFIGLLARELLAPSGKAAVTASNEPEQLFEESYWPMNNTGISHIVLGVRPPLGAYPVTAYLLYWNRSDHLKEWNRSGVQFKNIGFDGAAEWARVGQGGSQLQPCFCEDQVLHIFGQGEPPAVPQRGYRVTKSARRKQRRASQLSPAAVTMVATVTAALAIWWMRRRRLG